ncbi:beta-ribofuranosylaminobenzene 5'-phosphate synthase family protein [Methylotenera sp.]|uniref:beta-ribofuranosylaminobenzene 5'-phosphate synthase family protein n=1 Tax=Methylotenera sp. TaxID=2051956 RepID=UPI002486E52E|nr:beta-ribofuranosylaminobenzene 5'-phosphate synthase family protein [Methylotenera sp.]MDI1300063.1 GHMP kinase [Methylotenera sp.]
MSLVNFTEITVKSTARLHMGFFDLHGGLGRKFGGIGLSLSSPSQVLTARLSDTLQVSGKSSSRALAIAQQLLEFFNITRAVEIEIAQIIPEHAGLGSGTQLALAIGTAINLLHELNLTTAQIAQLTGRGGRSGIGIAAFDYGGLLVDGGRSAEIAGSTKADLKIPPLLARYSFPEDWRVLLILDESQSGIHGEEERIAFKHLPMFPENLAAHLCRHVLMQAMPAMVERDLTAFGVAIQALQSHVGDYFAPAQGGRYASPNVAEVLKHLEYLGIACFGQSSWGPTGFAVFENDIQAEACLQELKLTFKNNSLKWMICSGRNDGAEVTTNNI